MKLLTLKKTNIFSFVTTTGEIWPSMHYGEEEDANEFYVGLLQNLMSKLPEK